MKRRTTLFVGWHEPSRRHHVDRCGPRLRERVSAAASVRGWDSSPERVIFAVSSENHSFG
jgi:hypothetical protein